MSEINVLAKPKVGPTNPRNFLMYSSIERAHPDIKIDEFSVARLLFGEYDIFHMHWPDRIFRSRDLVVVFKALALFAALVWLRVRGAKVVWTVHNPLVKNRRPSRNLQRLYYWVLRTCVDEFVFPSSASRREFTKVWSRIGLRSPNLQLCENIPLGLQMELLEKGHRFPAELPATLKNYYLIIGRVDVEKNIRSTVTDLEALLQNETSRIVVAGMPNGAAMTAMLRELAALPRVTTLPRFLDEQEFNALVDRARAVVIDYPVTNSGVATLAAAMNANILFSNQQMVDDFASDYGYERCQAMRKKDGSILASLPDFGFGTTEALKGRGMFLSAIGERYALVYRRICEDTLTKLA